MNKFTFQVGSGISASKVIRVIDEGLAEVEKGFEYYSTTEVDSALAAKDAEIERLTLVKEDIADTALKLKAEIERYKRAVNWLRPKARYSLNDVPQDLCDIISSCVEQG